MIVEHLKQLEIHRLIKELDFIKSDYNYKSEVIGEADGEFLKSVDSFLDNNPQLKQVFDDKISSRKEIEDFKRSQVQNQIHTDKNFDIETHSDELEINMEENEAKPKIKNLYRSIAKSTHPDKLKDESLKELYIEATSAYESGNILPLFLICDKLRIPYEVSEEETDLIKEEINNVKNRVNFLESTFTWQWFTQKDQTIRDNVILTYVRVQLSR